MEILPLIITGIIGFLLFDFLYFGYLPKLLGMWPAIDELGSQEVLLDESIIWAHTDDISEVTTSHINSWMGYRSVVLTKDYFYFKKTNQTYVYKISVDDLNFFTVGKKFFKKTIILNNDDGKKTEIMPTNVAKWVDALEVLGVSRN